MGILVALPIAAAIAILDRRKIEEFLFMAIGVIVSSVLIAGFLGNTRKGVYCGIVLGVLAFLYCLVVFFRDRDRFRQSVCTPGLYGGLICMGITAILFIGTTDLGSDNDTFWAHAPQVINMYRYSDIGDTGRRALTFSLLYTAPVYTSWCYFCNVLWPSYSDGINLWARHLFCLAALMPFFSLVDNKNRRKGMVVFLLFILFLKLMHIVDTTLNFMPDVPIGSAIVYGTITAVNLYRDKERYNDTGYLAAVCIWIPLIAVMKRAGGIYIYGMIGIASVYTMDRIFSGKKENTLKKIYPLFFMSCSVLLTLWYSYYRGEYFDPDDFYTILPMAGVLLSLFLGIVCKVLKTFFVKKYYFRFLFLIGVIVFLAGSFTLFSPMVITEIVYERTTEVNWEIFLRFFSMWFTGGERFRGGWEISDLQFILILFLCLLMVRMFIARNRISYCGATEDLDNVIGTVFMGYCMYMMFYCFIYMFRQGAYLTDDGFFGTVRYLGPAVMLTAAVTIYELLRLKDVDQLGILLAAVILLVLVLPDNPLTVLRLERHTGWERYEKMYEEAGIMPDEEDNIYCIGPDHMQYYVFPAYSTINYEVKNAELEPEDWKADFLSTYYDYLILEDYEWGFAEKYQELFEGGIDSIQKWAVYDVVVEGNNVRFVKR